MQFLIHTNDEFSKEALFIWSATIGYSIMPSKLLSTTSYGKPFETHILCWWYLEVCDVSSI